MNRKGAQVGIALLEHKLGSDDCLFISDEGTGFLFVTATRPTLGAAKLLAQDIEVKQTELTTHIILLRKVMTEGTIPNFPQTSYLRRKL